MRYFSIYYFNSRGFSACYNTESIQPCTTKNWGIYWKRYKVQETLDIEQWSHSPLQSRHLGTLYSSLNHHQLPYRIFLNLINSLKSLFFERRFLFWKNPEVTGSQIWALRGESHLSGLIFLQKTLYEMLCMRGSLSWWSCQSPAAHSWGLLDHPNSFHRGIFKQHKIWCIFVAVFT